MTSKTTTTIVLFTVVFAFAVVFAYASVASAIVKLPNGKTIPDPMITCCSGKPCGLYAVFARACTVAGIENIGKACPGSGPKTCDEGKNGTCESRIWHKYNGNTCIPENQTGMHPQNDAAIKPETFQPACGRTFQLLTRGNAMFKNGFGWYNVPAGGAKPAHGDLHSLVACNTAAGKAIAFDLLKDPKYKGGDIGFYLVTPESHATAGTCAKGDCCASVARVQKSEGYIYYSQSKHNPDNNGSGSYIHLLLYASKILSHTFYFTWEDTYKGSSTDYSDFVTQVSGISCAGAGIKCDTTKAGICGLGVTKCDKEGKLACEATYIAQKEKCDGLDNDCNKKVDDGATCPPEKVCYQGACRPKCTASKEFPCQIGFECDKTTGLCVNKSCKGVTCKPGEVCVKGKCGTGCEGVVCPKGQICQAAACIDPCAGLTCGTAQICKWGVCLPDCTKCGGVTCKPGFACDTKSGDCYNSKCNPKCKAGFYCLAGKCVDFCHGVTCPGGLACKNGTCPPLGLGTASPTTDGAVPTTDGSVLAGDGGVPTTDGSGNTNKPFVVTEEGCGSCDAGRAPPSLPLTAMVLMLLLIWARRRGE